MKSKSKTQPQPAAKRHTNPAPHNNTAANKARNLARAAQEKSTAEARHAENRRKAEEATAAWQAKNWSQQYRDDTKTILARTLSPRKLFLIEMHDAEGHALVRPNPGYTKPAKLYALPW